MHATLWVDDRRRGWLALYADGARTWQAAIGSMPLSTDHEIPVGMPLCALVEVHGDTTIGTQPAIEYDGMRFTTTSTLRDVKGAPAYGVEPVSPVSGRHALKPGRARPGAAARQRRGLVPRRLYASVAAWVSFSFIAAILAGFGAAPEVIMAAGAAATAVVFVVSYWQYHQLRERSRRARQSRLRTTLRAVVWHSLSRTGEELLQPMLSLYPLDAGQGAAPIGTIPLVEEPDPPLPYADQVVVRGDLRPGGNVVIEHAGRTLIAASDPRTDIAPARPFLPPPAAT